MKFAGVDPATFGVVKVTGWKDERQGESLTTLNYRGEVRGAARGGGPRVITVTFLVLGEDDAMITRAIDRLTGWLTAERAACPLQGEGERWRYYRARCREVSAPERRGLTARLTAVFVCEDPRPYAAATGKPMVARDAPLCDFLFAGKHCYRDFGLLFEETGYHLLPAPEAAIYRVPGRDDTVRFPDTGRLRRTLTGRLYLCRMDGVDAPLSQSEARARAHRVAEWLVGAGRAPLIMDYEPEKYYEAEVLEAPVVSTRHWPSGCFDVTFACESVMRSVERQFVERRLGPGSGVVLLHALKTGLETPLTIEARNVGEAPLTGLVCRVDDGAPFTLEGLALAPGQTLTIDGEKQTVRAGDRDAFACYAGGAFPAVEKEGQVMEVFPAGGTALALSASARGRWL